MDREQPLVKRDMRIFENGSDRDCELFFTAATFPDAFGSLADA